MPHSDPFPIIPSPTQYDPPDSTLRPIPACATCRHWTEQVIELGEYEPHRDLWESIPDGWRCCARLAYQFPVTDPMVVMQSAWCHDAAIFTAPDFGCRAHEPKEDDDAER